MRIFKSLAMVFVLALPSLATAAPGIDEPISPYAEPSAALDDESAELESEEGASARSAAASSARNPSRAILRHIPPTEIGKHEELKLLAVIEDAWVEDGLIAHYRVPGATDFVAVDFERSSAGGYFALIPASDVTRAGIEYYITGRKGGALHFGSPDTPHRVRVEPPSEDRWIEVERKRLGNRRYSFDTSLSLYDFGDTHGSDRFVYGHVDWSHLLVESLYSIKLGFAFVQGATPSGTEMDAISEEAGVRYGYGGVRWRLRDKVWMDGKAMMGFGQDGFAAGLGAALTLGNDWRTAVSVGAEAMTELSYKAWLRLQWDTVPGVLMSAEVATTNQPDAKIDAGSYVEYKVRYPLSPTLEVAGTLNFGARGNRPGGFGGGLHTRYMF